MSEKHYMLSWFVDVRDDSAYGAACQGLGMQRDPDSTATIFTVRDVESGASVCVDAESGEEYPSDDRGTVFETALRAIHAELDGTEWNSGTFDRIANHVEAAGLKIREPLMD